MYKWGDDYDAYSVHPKIIPSHRKQRWEEMFSKPNINLTFKNQAKMTEIDNFYLLCQFQRQYCNDYTGHLHPMDYFVKDEYKWNQAPDLNSTYVQFPEMYVKYKQPYTLPLTTERAWLEPFEPFRRLTGKRDPYPDMKFPR